MKALHMLAPLTLRVLAPLLLFCLGCSGSDGARSYGSNDLQLLTAYTAKELCSCLFVMEREEDFCLSWTKAAPNLKTVRVDREGKKVQTQAVLFWGASARYVDAQKGCVLE